VSSSRGIYFPGDEKILEKREEKEKKAKQKKKKNPTNKREGGGELSSSFTFIQLQVRER